MKKMIAFMLSLALMVTAFAMPAVADEAVEEKPVSTEDDTNDIDIGFDDIERIMEYAEIL